MRSKREREACAVSRRESEACRGARGSPAFRVQERASERARAIGGREREGARERQREREREREKERQSE